MSSFGAQSKNGGLTCALFLNINQIFGILLYLLLFKSLMNRGVSQLTLSDWGYIPVNPLACFASSGG